MDQEPWRLSWFSMAFSLGTNEYPTFDVQRVDIYSGLGLQILQQSLLWCHDVTRVLSKQVDRSMRELGWRLARENQDAGKLGYVVIYIYSAL